MNMQDILMAERQRRRNLARQNSAVREEMMSIINGAPADERWSARISPDEVIGVTNREFVATYRTTRVFDELKKPMGLKLIIVVRDGGTVDICQQDRKVIATADGAQNGLVALARIITMYEMPNEVPADYQHAAKAS